MLIYSLIIMAVAVGVDQLTKALTVARLSPVGTSFEFIPGILNFTYVENRGAAFGMLADKRWVFIVISTLAIAVLVWYLAVKKPKDILLCTSLSLIAGGGIGNMIDRVALGYVVDMIDVRFIDFYVFNIADSAVCVGCGLMILYMILDEVRLRREKKAQTEDTDGEKLA